MERKLNTEQLALYKSIGEILWDDWDPIGMKYNGGPRDEYESYVPSILSLKIKGASIETITSKLFEIETQRMELDHGFEHCSRVAEKIFNLKY
jgi:hypothetical protein